MGTRIVKYIKIKNDIIKDIVDGILKPEDKIPSESQLREKYGVSAITVRRALSDLTTEGYVYAIQGLGTFVAKKQMIRGLTSISFSDELIQQGYSIDMKVINISEVVDEQIASTLDIDADTVIIKLDRVRYADDQPVAYQTSYISSELLSFEKAKELDDYKSFYKLLKSEGLVPVVANETYSVKDIDDSGISKSLDVKKGDSSFFVKRIAMDEDNVVLEYGETYFNKDWYSVTVNIKI